MVKEELIRHYLDLKPCIEDLPGDLAQLATIIEELAPGKGVDATLRIAQEFRGTYIYCHNTDALYRTARDRWLIEQYTKGLKVPNLARAVQLSERRVWKILGKEPSEDRQLKLFKN